MSDMLKPPEIAKGLSDACVNKATGKWINLAILGFFAGAFIAFGAQLAIMASIGTAAALGTGVAKIIIGSVFSVGLMLVVIAGAELWTGNNLMVISGFDKKVGWDKILGKWGIVFLFNFFGSIFVAILIWGTGLWHTSADAWGIAAVNIATAKVNLTFIEAFTRAILCNWLVCLAVWLTVSAKTTIGKIFACYFPIMAFVASGFEHIIANMFFIPMGLFIKGDVAASSDGLTWVSMVVNNFIPVTLGNLVGGAFFVGFLYWFVYLKNAK